MRRLNNSRLVIIIHLHNNSEGTYQVAAHGLCNPRAPWRLPAVYLRCTIDQMPAHWAADAWCAVHPRNRDYRCWMGGTASRQFGDEAMSHPGLFGQSSGMQPPALPNFEEGLVQARRQSLDHRILFWLCSCLYPISVMCPMLFLQNESATRVTGATIGTSYSSLLLIIRRISGKHDHHMRTTKYYQIGGFRPNVRWYVINVVWLVVTIQGARFENDWNDKKIVQFLAGPSSPLHPSKDRPLELLLGARLLSLLNWKHF